MNSRRSMHPIDVPWGTTAPPQPVVDALKALMKVASDHGVPFARIIEHPDQRTLRQLQHDLAEAKEQLERQARLIEKKDELIVKYEKQLGIDEL